MNPTVTYDELSGPDLDAARWSTPRLPLPGGGEHVPLDPNTELAVGEGCTSTCPWAAAGRGSRSST